MCVCVLSGTRFFFYPKTKDCMLEENQRSHSCRTSSTAGLIRPINITFRKLRPSPWHTRFDKKLWAMADASVLADFKSADVDLNNNDDGQSALMQLHQTVYCVPSFLFVVESFMRT